MGCPTGNARTVCNQNGTAALPYSSDTSWLAVDPLILPIIDTIRKYKNKDELVTAIEAAIQQHFSEYDSYVQAIQRDHQAASKVNDALNRSILGMGVDVRNAIGCPEIIGSHSMDVLQSVWNITGRVIPGQRDVSAGFTKSRREIAQGVVDELSLGVFRDFLFEKNGAVLNEGEITRRKVEARLAAGETVEPEEIMPYPDLISKYGI